MFNTFWYKKIETNRFELAPNMDALEILGSRSSEVKCDYVKMYLNLNIWNLLLIQYAWERMVYWYNDNLPCRRPGFKSQTIQIFTHAVSLGQAVNHTLPHSEIWCLTMAAYLDVYVLLLFSNFVNNNC